MDRLSIVNSQAQAVKDNTVNKDGNNEENLDRADDIIYIGQPTAKDLKNLAKLSKLINNVKYQWDNIGELM